MSPLSTITFETLRSRNKAALERMRYAPDEECSSLTTYQRRRIQQLLTERAELEDLASTQSQREAYGIEEWHAEFVRLRDLSAHQHSALEGDALRTHVWNAVPNSRFKRFQETFCHPHQCIVPQFEIDQQSRVTFTGNPNFNEMSLAPCLVSPDRIPEKLAENLCLVEFEESDQGQPYERLRKKAQPEVIARLKKIWESAVPLQRGHHRLLSIRPPDTVANARYPDVAGPDPSIIGTILYTREEENGRKRMAEGSGKMRQLSVQHFSNVYAAFRKTLHENRAYEKEIRRIGTLQADIQRLNRRIDRDWKRDTPDADKERMLSEARRLLTQGRELLAACANRYKVQAHDLLAQLIALGPQGHKQRIGASLARMVAIINRLQSRFDEMYPKGGFNEQDQMVLTTHIVQHERCMRAFRGPLQENAHILENGLALFGEQPLSPKQRDSQVTGMLRRMGMHPEDLDSIRLRPFTTYAGRLREKHALLESALRRRDLEASRNAMVHMHVIGKFQAVHTCFEHVKQYIAYGERIPISHIRDFIHRLRELFSTYQVFPDHRAIGYEDAFTYLQDELERLEEGLEHYANQDMDVGKRTAIYRELKRYLQQCDIEEMVKTLP